MNKFPRHLTLRDLPKRDRGQCRWCGRPVPKGRRRSWCSQACVDAYLLRADAGRARAEVFRRDGGVCALCKIDAGRLRRLVRGEVRRIRGYVSRNQLRHLFIGPGDWGAFLSDFTIFGRCGVLIDGQRIELRESSYWQVDHIVPVAEGGGACGLDNLRTLCWRCHPRETGQLRRRLNARQRPQQALPL